ncbi:UxaA family hydrolase [Desulfotomaculum copahuensis]|uniref:SAF domain-containing protein n=1 Tax=Desulfotomaculum copahuensis TaxID=1838280 RepID=A0A1B7LHS0_9FIRM|nr:UxaA family hydrolase [Desulfotomaculum copahuensis]OAT85835.1 hypothetical protein A6M21_04975 [Desulfotomaculum copahuensis]
MEYKVLVHKPGDSTGVVITNIAVGEKVAGLVTENNTGFELEACSNIPLGHKIALKPVAAGEKIIIYGWSCGYASQPISAGEHVHVHNMKSARWR